MDDDGKASGESRQDHPTTAASAPAQEGKIEPFASTFAGATIDVAAGPAGTATRKPRTSSATSVQPTSPPCRNDSTGSKKTGSRHSSGNSRKNSSTLNCGRNGSSLTVDPHSAALVVCTGSQGSSRLNNRRLSSSNSGSLIGTITARKCVGCAAGRDSIVCSATSQRKRSKDDARNDPNVHSSLTHPSIFTGTTLYSSAVASSSACGSVPTFSPRLQQECLRKREDEQEEKQSRSEEGQQAQPKHLPQNTPREELHHPQHGKDGMQQLPSPGFMQILYTQTVKEEGQHITGSVLQSEISLAPQFDAVHSNVNPPRPPEQRSPTPVLLNPPQPCVERNHQTHHKYLREQQRFKNLQHNQTLNLLKQTTHLQGHPAEPVQHSKPQGMQRNLHLRGQNQQSEQVKQATEQGPLLELNAVSFADRKATQSEMAGTAGGSSGTGRLPDTTALYAATAAGRRDGLIVSFPNPQENRLGLIPSVYGGEISAVSRTPVQQQLQRQLGMEMKNSAVLGPSVQAVGPLGSGPGPSPSVAAMATTPRIRLAAASQRHQPPPCTTVLPALPRCSVSASGAYPEMPPVPVLNSEFDATAAATGEVRLSPTAAAILRGAASAAAAAAAAATDAASLVKCGNWAPELTGSSASVANTGVCGAGQSAPVAAAATLTSTALHAFLADSPGGQKSDQSTGFIVGNSTSVHQAAGESTRPQQMAPHQPQHPQHFDSCDSQGTLRTSTVVSAEGAEHPSAPTSTSRSVSVDGTGGRTLLNSGDSSVSSEARMEKLQHLTATAAFHTPCFEDATGAACERAATAGIDLIASSLPRRRAPMAVVADTLAATSPATLKIHALGPVKPEKFPAKFLQAFPHSGSPPILRVGNATQGETAVALADASESACRMEPPTDACGVAASVLTCNKKVKEDLYQKLFADNGAPASDTPAAPREAEIVTVAAEKKEVSPTNLGNTTAKDSNKCAAITSESVTPVTGARPGSVTGLNCLSQKFGMANPALRPLQLPESPCYGSCTTGGENTAVGTPGGDTKLTKCLSPDTTPGTPQNCQLQQLLMHRTPAPQDRPRRPAAASAAGLLVRRGGPVTMWGFGAAMDAAVSSAAVASVTQSVTDAAAVTSSLDAGGDVTACGSAVAVADDDGTESAVVCEKPEGDGNLQPDQEDPTQKATNSEKTLRCEKNNQSVVLPGPEESDSDRSFNSNPTATLAPSAAEQLQTESTLRTAEKMSFETDDRGDVKLVEMHQEKLHTVHDGGEAGQPPSPQQQHQQDTQHPLKLDEKPSIQEGEAEPLPQSLHNSEAQQKDLYNSYAAVQQQIPVEFGQQRGCQSRWGKQEMLRCTQIGAKEETALQGEHSLPLHVKEGSDKELCSAKSLAPVPSDLEKTTCLSPSVTNRIAAGAVDVTPVSSFIPAVVEAERQRDVQVENSDTYHSEELVYFSGSNKSSNSGSSSIRKRNSKKLVKQHSSGSDRTRSSLRCSNDSINEQGGLCSSRGGSRSGDYTQKNRGNETCNSSDSELTYFPFLKDQEFLTESQVGGDSEAMTPPAAGGMTSMTYTGDSATWQMHIHTTNVAEDALRRANCHYRTSTETGVAEQLPFPQELGQQQQASESPAVAFEWESSEFQQRYGSVEQRGFSKHESDMDDNLPLSAAAMAAALAAGSSDISDSSVAPRAACHERSPEQQFTPTSQKHLPCSDLREGVHYRMSTPVAEHLDTPWATPTSGRGPAYNLHTSRNNEQTTGEFVPPKFYPQHGRQQQVLSAPQQQVLTGQAHMSRPSRPLPAAERPLFQDECSAFPGASALPAHLQPLQQQNRHLLQEPDEQTSPPLLQATIGDKAAPFVVETGRSSSTYNTQQEAVLMGPSRECVTPQQQHLQQSLRQQQHLQSVHQQLMLHQQQQQQVARTRQPVYSLSRSRLPDSCDAQMLQRLGAAHASGLIVSNHWNRNSLPTRPCLWPQESYTHENLPCSAISSSHRCTSSNTAQPSSPRLKRAGPGAAAVTLAAVTGSAPIGINTAIEDTATSGPAGDAADLTSLPDEQQEGRQEAFCPFRRTVETRRARSNPLGTSHSIAASAGSTSEEEISADEAGGVRGQSLSNNRHTSGTLRKRFLGGTKRLFGGVKMHAAAANTRDKLPLNNCECRSFFPYQVQKKKTG